MTDAQATQDRRQFLESAVTAGATLAFASFVQPALGEDVANQSAKPIQGRVRVGVIGCGSVSGRYFPQLKESPFVELVSCCDIISSRAADAAKLHGVPNHFPHIDKMLAGVPSTFS